MILEGILTTLSPEGLLNIAPMGPKLGPDLSMKTFELRPFRSTTTYQNLASRGEGVFHVTDDVLLLAQAAIGVPLVPEPNLSPARLVAGSIIGDSCRYYEFRVTDVDYRADRVRFTALTLAEGRLRDFLGFNRRGMLWWRQPFSPPGRRACHQPRYSTSSTGLGSSSPRPAAMSRRQHSDSCMNTFSKHSHELDSTRPQHAHEATLYPNCQPPSLRFAGLGSASGTPVWRHWADDRGTRDQTARRAGAQLELRRSSG